MSNRKRQLPPTSSRVKRSVNTMTNLPVQASSSASNGATVRNYGKSFAFHLAPAEMLEQLVNNEYLSDVRFKVGQSGKLMYAHKIIITLASEVFFAQFNGQFSDAQDSQIVPICVEDIQEDIFQEVLKYMYCRKITVNWENVLDVYYAAKKYMLDHLQLLCEDVIRQSVTEDNVLKIFQGNRFYAFDMVDELCLKLICDNPLKLFKQAEFLELDHGALEKICSSTAMNCQLSQMKDAIGLWEKSNGKFGKAVNRKQLLCRKIHFFSMSGYSEYINADFQMLVTSPVALYGIGIYVGVKHGTYVPSHSIDVDVLVKDTVKTEVRTSHTVPISNELQTYEIMFEKVVIIKDCSVQVTVKKPGKLKDTQFFCLNGFHTADVSNTSPRFVSVVLSCYSCNQRYPRNSSYCSNCGVYGNGKSGNHCIAYLLCQEV